MEDNSKRAFADGVEQYRLGNFVEAERLLKQGLSVQRDAWEMRFYLAMALARQARNREAKYEFMSIRDLCPTVELRTRANAAITALGALC